MDSVHLPGLTRSCPPLTFGLGPKSLLCSATLVRTHNIAHRCKSIRAKRRFTLCQCDCQPATTYGGSLRPSHACACPYASNVTVNTPLFNAKRQQFGLPEVIPASDQHGDFLLIRQRSARVGNMYGPIEYVERGHHAGNLHRSISRSVLALKCGLEATNFAARFDASSSNKPRAQYDEILVRKRLGFLAHVGLDSCAHRCGLY